MNNMSDSGWSNQAIQAFLVEVISGQPGSGLFVYNGNPALGNPPVLSVTAPGVTADPSGNAVPSGALTVKSPEVIQVLGSVNNSIILEVVGGFPLLGFFSGATEEAKAAEIGADISNPGASETIQTFWFSAQGSVHTDRVGIGFASSAADGSSPALINMAYIDSGGVTHNYATLSNHGLRLLGAYTGDGNTYQPEELRQVITADLLINSVSGPQVFPTASIGVGTYEIDGQIHIATASVAGAANFQFGGGAAVATMGIEFVEIGEGAPGGLGNVGNINAFSPTSYTSSVFNGTGRVYWFKGTVVCTTAGLWALFASCTIAADTYTITRLGTYMNIKPVGP